MVSLSGRKFCNYCCSNWFSLELFFWTMSNTIMVTELILLEYIEVDIRTAVWKRTYTEVKSRNQCLSLVLIHHSNFKVLANAFRLYYAQIRKSTCWLITYALDCRYYFDLMQARAIMIMWPITNVNIYWNWLNRRYSDTLLHDFAFWNPVAVFIRKIMIKYHGVE